VLRFADLDAVPEEVTRQWRKFDTSLDSPAARAWHMRKPVFFGGPDVLDREFPHLAGARAAAAAGSCLAVPLITGGEVTGVLAVTWPGARQLRALQAVTADLSTTVITEQMAQVLTGGAWAWSRRTGWWLCWIRPGGTCTPGDSQPSRRELQRSLLPQLPAAWAQLAAAASRPAADIQDWCDHLPETMTGGSPLTDDVAILCVGLGTG
jgi:hypothetical protein